MTTATPAPGIGRFCHRVNCISTKPGKSVTDFPSNLSGVREAFSGFLFVFYANAVSITSRTHGVHAFASPSVSHSANKRVKTKKILVTRNDRLICFLGRPNVHTSVRLYRGKMTTKRLGSRDIVECSE